MTIQPFEGLEQFFKSVGISDRGLRVAQLQRLLNTPLLDGIVRMKEEDVCFPCLQKCKLSVFLGPSTKASKAQHRSDQT